MHEQLALEIENLEKWSTRELQAKYVALHGEQPHTHNRIWLLKRIAWRIQANELGDITERARRRAVELADDAELRIRPPKELPFSGSLARVVHNFNPMGGGRDPRLPLPGTILSRDYKGTTVQITILEEGCIMNGRRFRSLSAAATAATGKKWNGFQFFGLT